MENHDCDHKITEANVSRIDSPFYEWIIVFRTRQWVEQTVPRTGLTLLEKRYRRKTLRGGGDHTAQLKRNSEEFVLAKENIENHLRVSKLPVRTSFI